MKRIMDLCMKHDIEFKLEFCPDQQSYFRFVVSKYTDTTKRNFAMNLSLIEYQESRCFDAFIDYFCIRVLEEFQLNTVETILERAKVEYMDDPISLARIVVSRNPIAPLTDDEKAMIKRMWNNQHPNLNIIFKEA